MERVTLAERGSFGWRQSKTAAQFLLELNNMFQRAVNGLADTNGHQDDFILLMDNADGAPYAYDNFFRTTDRQMVLEPPFRWEGRLRTVDQVALRKTLDELSAPRPTPSQEHPEQRLVERLRRQNAELQLGIAHLMELVELYELHRQIEDFERLNPIPHPMRRNYTERRAVIWVRAVDWVRNWTHNIGARLKERF